MARRRVPVAPGRGKMLYLTPREAKENTGMTRKFLLMWSWSAAYLASMLALIGLLALEIRLAQGVAACL